MVIILKKLVINRNYRKQIWNLKKWFKFEFKQEILQSMININIQYIYIYIYIYDFWNIIYIFYFKYWLLKKLYKYWLLKKII